MHDQYSGCSKAQTVWEYSTHFINQAVNGLLIPDQSHFTQLIESNFLEFMEMKPSPHVPDQPHISVCMGVCKTRPCAMLSKLCITIIKKKTIIQN